MSMTWHSEEPEPESISVMGWIRVVVRGIPLGVVTFGCLAILLLVRLVERPIWGVQRPWTPFVTQFVCRTAFRILGMGFGTTGQPMTTDGAIVANHASWLDIFTLNAPMRIYYVAKAEVASWPGIGWLARATGTVFITRSRQDAQAHRTMLEERLMAGHKLVFFPEGTSTDGRRVLPFRPTLFAAFFDPELKRSVWIQPVTVVYTAPEGEDARFYGWWGHMGFAEHLLKVLAVRRQGRVDVHFHAAHKVSDYDNRKDLALSMEAEVRAGMDQALAVSPSP